MSSINEIEINKQVFNHPFACMMAGPSMSGKTTLLTSILEQANVLIQPPPNKIIYCYSMQQPCINVPNIIYHKGIPDIDTISEKDNNLLILDDLMKEAEKDPGVLDLFTKECHHKSISTFFITQNLFQQGKNCRTISLNSHYLLLFNNPRDRQQISCLARQIFPDNTGYFLEVYKDAVEDKKYGHLLVDLHQKTHKNTRLVSNIDKDRIYYIPKDFN